MLGDDQRTWTSRAIAAAETAWTVLGSPVVFGPLEVDGRVNTDAWDGFAGERDSIAADLRAGSGRPLVLSGDVHAEVVLETPGAPAIPELVCPSISSLFGDSLGADASALPDLVPNVRHAADRRGWLRVDLHSTGDLVAGYREVVDAADLDSAVVAGPSFRL